MKITASKPDLEVALSIATIGLGSGSDLSSYYLFRVAADGIGEILTYNSRITVAAPLSCTVEDGEPGDAMTVEGWRLQKWLSGAGDVAVTLEDTARGEVTVSSPRSTVRLKSMDPKKFPFWDKTLGEAAKVATMASTRLARALSYAKSFVWSADTTRPDISQVEILDGYMWATDMKAVTLIKLEGMDESNLRIHGGDLPSVLKFLNNKTTDEVEVCEHDRTVFFKRKDGAVIGAARPLSKFPKMGVDPNSKDMMFWEVSSDDMKAGFHCLSATTDKDNTRVKFLWENDQVHMRVKAVVGGEDSFPLPPIEHDGLDSFPDKGFLLDYPYVTHIADCFGETSLKFGLNTRTNPKNGKKGGFTAFRNTVDNDEFLTVIVWR